MFNNWLINLTVIDALVAALVVIALIIIGYVFWCKISENIDNFMEIDAENYNPEWMDYDKWKENNI